MFATDKVIGKEIDGYRILEVLGRGGMGIVYKAEDVALSRTVALKMIDPMLAHDEAFLRRFRAEAQALARIQSPYIVGVHALRRTDVGSFIVMEYVDGGTLYDLRTPYPWQQALPVLKQMLTALDHAHSVGVIHRDIKPRNIMLTKSGVVKVTDFGLAKLRQDDRTATVTQGIAGTLFYMSPEQVKNLSTLDHRSDLYSMGMTMYELLAGRLPFDKEASEFTTMRRIVEDRYEPPDRFNPGIPALLTGVILKALEKNPEDRFQSAAEMLAVIEAFDADRTIAQAEDATIAVHAPAALSAPSSRTPVKTRRIPWTAVGVAIGVVLLAAMGYVLYGQSGSGAGDDVVTPQSVIPEHVGDTVAEEASPPENDPARTQEAAQGRDSGTENADNVSDPVASPEPPAYASIVVNADGSGVVKLNGQAVAPGSSHQVRAGAAQRIDCGEPPRVASKTVTLTPNETEDITCYFRGLVSIVTRTQDGETPWGAIWINGDNTGKYTPLEMELPLGQHRITARRDGYTVLDVETVELAPSFERQVVPVVITLRKDASY